MTDHKFELEVFTSIEASIPDREKAIEMMEGMAETQRLFLESLQESGFLKDVVFEVAIDAYDPEALGADGEAISPELTTLPLKTVNEMRRIFEKHKATTATDLYRQNDYVRGMYNGMEVLMCIMEDRPAMFMNEEGEFYRTVKKA